MTHTTARLQMFRGLLTAVLIGGCADNPEPAHESEPVHGVTTLELSVDAQALMMYSVRVCGSRNPAVTGITSCISTLGATPADCPCFNSGEPMVIDRLCPSDPPTGLWQFTYAVYTTLNCQGTPLNGVGSANPNNFICYDTMNLAEMLHPNASVDEVLEVGSNENHIACISDTARKSWTFENCKTAPGTPTYPARYNCGCTPSAGTCSCPSGVSPPDLGAGCKFETTTCNIVCGTTCTMVGQCNDNKTCTTDACTNGLCTNTPQSCEETPTPNPCTVDTCTTTGCVHMPIGDGRPCGNGGSCYPAGTCGFPCDDTPYIITIDPGFGGNSTLNRLVTSGVGTGNLERIATLPSVMNALAMHPVTRAMYAIDEGTIKYLYRIQGDGTYANLGVVSGLANKDWWGGAFLQNGTMVAISSGMNASTQPSVAFINVDTNTVTSTKLVAGVRHGIQTSYPVIYDLTPHPITGEVWAFCITNESTGLEIEGFGVLDLNANPVTFTRRFRAQPGISSLYITGAIFSNQAGDMYLYGSNSNGGSITQEYLDSISTSTGRLTRVLRGPAVDHSDGTSCQWK